MKDGKKRVTFWDSKNHEEEIGLLKSDNPLQDRIPTNDGRRWHMWCIYLVVCLQSLVIFVLLRWPLVYLDPTLAIWSPANEVVKYETVHSTEYFFNRSPYVGTDRVKIDAMWEDLYDYGTSAITENEASKLLNKTLTAPKADGVYLIELQMIHDLHCLNMLRKVAYPDEYPEMFERHENGMIDHDSRNGFHVDHCIDALRQSIMCTGDVSPIRYAHHQDDPYHVFPILWNTRTCRNFDAIRGWAKERQALSWILAFGEKPPGPK